MPFSGGGSTVTGAVTVSSGTVTVSSGNITVAGAVETDRKTTSVTVVIASGAAVSAEIDMRDYSSGTITFPATWTTADLGAQLSSTSGGTFGPLKDRSNAYGTDVSIDGPVASAIYPMPPYWFGAHYLKLWSHDGAGSGVNQAGDRSMVVTLKS